MSVMTSPRRAGPCKLWPRWSPRSHAAGRGRPSDPGAAAELDPAQHQMLHGIEADCPALDGAADAGQHILEAEHLQQPQDLDILALAGFAHAGLQEAAQ